MIGRQLPAHSPLELGAIVSAAALAPREPERALERLTEYLCARFGARRAFLLGSGTQALQMALELVSEGRPSPSRVGLPAYTCYDVATAAVGAGTGVELYDIEPRTLAPDAAGVRSVLDRGLTAVVVNSLYGFPVDWHEVRSLCAQAGALLIEDAAQAQGSGWRGSEGGTFGDLTVLSFGRGKGWTGGGGGALLVRSSDLDVDRLSARVGPSRSGTTTWLKTLAQWALGRPATYWMPASVPGLHLGETLYHAPGRIHAIAPTSAHLVRAGAEHALSHVAVRRHNADRWYDRLDGRLTDAICVPLEGEESGFLRFPVRPSGAGLAVLSSGEAVRHGVAPGYPLPLHRLSALRGLLGAATASFPGAEELASRLRTLPTHAMVRSGDFRGVTELLTTA